MTDEYGISPFMYALPLLNELIVTGPDRADLEETMRLILAEEDDAT